jgi:hypothetical protein
MLFWSDARTSPSLPRQENNAMAFDWNEALATCYAAERRLVEASEPEAMAGLTPAKLRHRASKAGELAATWRGLAERFAESIQGQASSKDLRYLAMIQNKAALFAEAERRFQERLKQTENESPRKRAVRMRDSLVPHDPKGPAGPLSADEAAAKPRIND